MIDTGSRIVVWFSCGAASAVALYQAIKIYGHDRVTGVYCDTSKNEHPDNIRFRLDVEKWLNIQIKLLLGDFSTIEDVAEKTKYMAGVRGARCTVEMKKVPRFRFQRPDDTHVFGFTSDEAKRASDFSNNNFDLRLAWVLINAGISKNDCFRILRDNRIELPVLYGMGYRNNNCIGCFKATSAAYWNRIRIDFPDIFDKRAKQSRQLGVRLTRVRGKRVFLDELPSEYMLKAKIREDLSCGPQCSGNLYPPHPQEKA